MEFKNWGTVTGRLSGDGQQMPKGWLQFRAEGEGEDILVWKQGEEAKEQEFSLRRLIKPRPGYVLVKGDYSQIEMHILGYYMKDPVFTAWLASGYVHAAAALEIWGDGCCSKDYLWIDDFLLVLQEAITNSIRGVFNIGSGENFSILELLAIVEKALNASVSVVHRDHYSWDVLKCRIDSSAFSKATGWKPRCDISREIELLLS